MRTDVVIKTHFRDLAFCSYALRFLERNWCDPESQIVVLANEDCRPVISEWGFPERFKCFYVDPWPDGNQFQCYLTLLLDHFSDADLFAIFDSDTMLVEPFGPADKMINGRPIIYCKLEADMLKSPESALAHKLWLPIMERWLGQKPPGDYMWAFPFMYWKETISGVRRLITGNTGKGLLESLYSDTEFDPAKFEGHPFKFCEHNVISFYAALREPDRYRVLDLKSMEFAPVKQYHSWSGFTPDIQDELDRMLRA